MTETLQVTSAPFQLPLSWEVPVPVLVRCQCQNPNPDTPTTHVPYLRRARLGTPGRLNYVECQSERDTTSYLCTLSAAPELGSASARASEVSVKTLILTPQQSTHIGPGSARTPRNSRTLGRLNHAEYRSDSNTIKFLCTLSASPELGSASTRASEVSVKTLTLTLQQRSNPLPYLRCVHLRTPGRLNYAECRSDSSTVSYLCTLSAACEPGSASARASGVWCQSKLRPLPWNVGVSGR